MSEPMSTVEIEDVLSSIRRLVSEDFRPGPRHGASVDGGEKLILTPALRVVADDSGMNPATNALFPEGQESSIHAAHTDHVEAWPGDPEDQSPQNAAQTDGGADTETRFTAESEAPASDFQALLDGISSGDHNQDEADDLPDPAGSAVDEPASIEAVVAALGAAVTGQGWEGEAEDATVEAGWSHQDWADANRDEMVIRSINEVEEAEVLASDPMPATVSWTSEEDRGVVSFTAMNPTDLSPPPLSDEDRANLAEAEAVAEILQADGGIDPDIIVSEAVVDEAIVAAAAAMAEGRIRVFDEEDAVADEEVLRDLVRDIIREELHGALGERITRNVRKLVRAEINRALATREFD